MKEASSYRGLIVPVILFLVLVASIVWFPSNPLDSKNQQTSRGPFDLAPPSTLELNEGVLILLQSRSMHDMRARIKLSRIFPILFFSLNVDTYV
jgi:hypothetical protein